MEFKKLASRKDTTTSVESTNSPSLQINKEETSDIKGAEMLLQHRKRTGTLRRGSVDDSSSTGTNDTSPSPTEDKKRASRDSIETQMEGLKRVMSSEKPTSQQYTFASRVYRDLQQQLEEFDKEESSKPASKPMNIPIPELKITQASPSPPVSASSTPRRSFDEKKSSIKEDSKRNSESEDQRKNSIETKSPRTDDNKKPEGTLRRSAEHKKAEDIRKVRADQEETKKNSLSEAKRGSLSEETPKKNTESHKNKRATIGKSSKLADRWKEMIHQKQEEEKERLKTEKQNEIGAEIQKIFVNKQKDS